ncbi:MAG: class I SAM-dependent methyltransferase [Planctomycetaceae bacterium]
MTFACDGGHTADEFGAVGVDTDVETEEPAERAPNRAKSRRAKGKSGAETTRRYTFRSDHDPDGIGKFYMGREIAHVVGGPGTIQWLERPEREKEEATSKMIDELKLEPGMIVADIGTGSGLITRMMAPRVAPEGRVVAVDVQQEMLDILAGKLKLLKIDNVDLVRGTEKSPRLPAESLDLALMVDVYHEFAWPYEMMLEISKAMKPGGRVVFVEFKREDPSIPIKLVHKMSEKQVQKEIGLPEFHLKWKETIGTLPWQHVIVFEKQAHEAEKETAPGERGASAP